ncbi:hypothetical protein PO909_003595, partial [Leuciscus waleckii]
MKTERSLHTEYSASLQYEVAYYVLSGVQTERSSCYNLSTCKVFLHMNSLMQSQTRSSNKALPTVTTHMISLTGVCFLVL